MIFKKSPFKKAEGAKIIAKKSPFAVKITKLINLAKEADKNCEEFGAKKHRYKLNPVISLEEVRDFERRHKIKFPQGYVDFLTQVGNGGAGSDYGIYSLEEVEFHNYYNHSNAFCHYTVVKDRPDYYTLPYTIEGEDIMLNSQTTQEKWNEWYNKLKTFIGDDADYNKICIQAYNGLLEIVDSGCTYCVMLICDGDMYGEVTSFAHDLYMMPHPIHMSFEDWMIKHFENVVKKYKGK